MKLVCISCFALTINLSNKVFSMPSLHPVCFVFHHLVLIRNLYCSTSFWILYSSIGLSDCSIFFDKMIQHLVMSDWRLLKNQTLVSDQYSYLFLYFSLPVPGIIQNFSLHVERLACSGYFRWFHLKRSIKKFLKLHPVVMYIWKMQ